MCNVLSAIWAIEGEKRGENEREKGKMWSNHSIPNKFGVNKKYNLALAFILFAQCSLMVSALFIKYWMYPPYLLH